MFVRNDGKKNYNVHVLYPLLYLCGQKGKKQKVMLFMGPKNLLNKLIYYIT
jgi:hypothetical protein